ncbi:hypothetical protein V8B97DRAFT_1946361 [Scleroderma yunnanense]
MQLFPCVGLAVTSLTPFTLSYVSVKGYKQCQRSLLPCSYSPLVYPTRAQQSKEDSCYFYQSAYTCCLQIEGYYLHPQATQ